MDELRTLIKKYNDFFSSYLAGKDSSNLLNSLHEEVVKHETLIPEVLHFVWIGDMKKADLSYLPVWHTFNPAKTLHLWVDDSSSFCQNFHTCLKEWNKNYPQKSLQQLQNKAFDYIYPKVMGGETFNDVAVSYLVRSGIYQITEEKLNEKCSKLLPDGIVKKDILSLFSGEFSLWRKYYYYELIIRGNLAAASDIIRLLILLKHGGIYVDVDTLPYFSDVFIRTNEVERYLALEDNEKICLAKSSAFMAWFNKRENIMAEAEEFLAKIATLQSAEQQWLSSSIHRDICEVDINKIKSLNDLKLIPNMILIGATDFLPGIYYNNILCSESGSIMIRIILCNIIRHYKFIETHGAIFNMNVNDYEKSEILIGYRHHDKLLSESVTRWLTGPGVIIDTLIDLIYKIIPATRALRPEVLSVILHRDEFRLTLKLQTLDTPMGLK